MRTAQFVLGAVLAILFFSTAAGAASPRAVFEKYGLFGTWAADCTKPESERNPHATYRPLPAEGVRTEYVWRGRFYVDILESAIESAPGELAFTWKRIKGGRRRFTNRVRLRRDKRGGVQMRLMDLTLDSREKVYVNGRNVRENWETQWHRRCGVPIAHAG